MSDNAPVRVFISGACAGLAEVRQALGTHPEIEIVGTAVEPARAAQKLAASNAQVVLHGSSRAVMVRYRPGEGSGTGVDTVTRLCLADRNEPDPVLDAARPATIH